MTITKPDTYEITRPNGDKEQFVYSPEFRMYMDDVKRVLSRNNYLLFSTLVFITIVLLIVALIYFQTGIVGRYLASGVCK